MDKREQARKMYEEGSKYKDISGKLDIPLNTLKSWKKRRGWQRGGATKKKQPSNRGAPLNNQNAKGNKGGAAKPFNKNAVKTGEYETIFAEYLTEEEKVLFQLEADPLLILQEEIKLLRIRQRRMMQRLQAAEAGLDQKEIYALYEMRSQKKVTKEKGKVIKVNGPEELQITEKKEKTYRKINDILAIEEALTRVSNQLTKSIKEMEQLDLNYHRKQLMVAEIDKLHQEMNKNPDPTEQITIILGDDVDYDNSETV